MCGVRIIRCLAWLAFPLLAAGCGTTRMTDTQRAASEMLLVSQAVDQAVAQFDFSEMNKKPVFLDVQYLDGTVDRGYVISSLRQQLLAYGALLQEDRNKAAIIVEPRSGAVGTDRNSLLVGTSQMSLPSVLPGQPTQIPEIALIKKTDQRGIAKLAVFAYNRQTGEAFWESGMVEAKSTLKDMWIFGAGPFSRGTIRRRTELAGEPLPQITGAFDRQPSPDSSPEIALRPVVKSVLQPAAGTDTLPAPELQPVGPPPVQPLPLKEAPAPGPLPPNPLSPLP